MRKILQDCLILKKIFIFSVEHVMAGGKRGQIYFTDGTRNEISKRKEGGLEVVSI